MIPSRDVCVVVPTLNEVGTIKNLCLGIYAVIPECTILIVDDGSTDGTLTEINFLTNNDYNLKVVSRPKRLGIGSAHKEGIRKAVELGFKIVVTMDADLTHDPKDIRRLLDELDRTSIVIGSRFLPGGGLKDWALSRKVLTHFGHFLTRHFIGCTFDASTAFRAYHLDTEITKMIEKTSSNSYSFFLESLALFENSQIAISEIPVVLPNRTYGHSKMRLRDPLISIYRLFEVRRMLRREKNEN
jgi:dolichol-phosphate mannosyltransferase